MRLRIAMFVLAACALVALPCSVPVFRYALERWPTEPYDVVVFHKGPLTKDQQAALEWLKEQSEAEVPTTNVLLHAVDLGAKPDEGIVKLWEKFKGESLPWMLVLYPRSMGIPIPAWSVAFTPQNARLLINSPAREKIAKATIGGATIVWLLLESGEKKKDEAAAALLKKELTRLEKEIEIPEVPDDGFYDPQNPPEQRKMKISFPVVRMSRSDPAERAFVNMLLRIEEDLWKLKDTMVFPFYGRGRALFALVGEGINTENIEDVCAFLLGPCSCQVKAMAPGVDMLVRADWDSIFEEGEPADEPQLAILPTNPTPLSQDDVREATQAEPTTGTEVAEGPAAKPTTSVAAARAAAPPSSGLVRNIAVIVLAGIVIVGAASIVLIRKKKPGE